MKRCGLIAILAVLLFWASPGSGGPIGGGASDYIKLQQQQRIPLKAIRFKGGERACVILVGDHRPVVDVAIYVYDDSGKLVVKDDPGGDFCAAIWYPPRDGYYRIEIESRGSEWNKCYLSVK